MPNIMQHRESSGDASVNTHARQLTIALAGNPNSGKTTIFNSLTGGRQHVGNYPGVTVEKKEGFCRFGDARLRVVDLPGTYSLTAYSAEELLARDCLIHDRPDAVVDILDASNLERNLYLAVQIMELGAPLVLALNMSDVARQRGIEFDLELLAKLLGVAVVPTVGHKGAGRNELLAAAVGIARTGRASEPLHVDYGSDIEAEIARLSGVIEHAGVAWPGVPSRWLAVKLLEGDAEVRKRIAEPAILDAAERAARHVESVLGDSPEALIAERRYGFIAGACREAVRSTASSRQSASDQIDKVLVSRWLGLPIFAIMMLLVFQLTFTLGARPMEWIEAGFARLGAAVNGLWAPGSDSMLRSLLVDGIIAGVGGVLVFLPNILLLFLAIAVLEDSGYMARAAFIMDRLMHKIGLHGKSFVPMLIGFGCSVPAIMATRTLESRRDRLTTMLVLPLMSCGARLPIYLLIIPAFFANVVLLDLGPLALTSHAALMMMIYVIGMVLAVISAKLLKATLLRGETPPFVMELPPYRMPTLRSVGLHMWNRGGAYLKKAATIILGISIVLWAMQQWPGLPAERAKAFEQQRADVEARQELDDDARDEALAEIDNAQAEAALEASLMGRVGKGIEPVLRPAGFDWKISTAMIGAFAAKEVFVAQLGIVYSLGEIDPEDNKEFEPLQAKLKENYSPLVGLCIMLFCLISAPCMATIAVTRRESNSWRWALFQLLGLTVIAWIVTVAVYQVGSLIVG